MATPRLGAPELVSAQAIPETTVNEAVRYLEQGASFFIVKDKDIDDPPGAPADGDAYIVHTASPTGAWTGWGGRIAIRVNTAWEDITPIEGMFAYVQDENKLYYYNGAAWAEYVATSSLSEASAAEVRTGTENAKYISPDKLFDAAAFVALTDGATVTPDFSAGLNFTWTIGGNRTLANPTNAKEGQQGTIQVTQDGTGSRLISSYGANYRFAGGTDIVLSTTASAIDLLFYQVLPSGLIFLSAQKAIAA
jgi:hypothetical protein